METVNHFASVCNLRLALCINVIIAHLRVLGPVVVSLPAERVNTARILEQGANLLYAVIIDMVIFGRIRRNTRELGIASIFPVKITPSPANAHTAVGALIHKIVKHLEIVCKKACHR